jgi:hypothetical protein
MPRKATFQSGLALQVVVGAFLVTLGIAGLVQWGSNAAELGRDLSRAFGRPSDPFNLIVALVELASGAVIVAGAFIQVQNKLLYAATLAITLLWLALIIISRVAQDFLEPDALVWINVTAVDLIVLFTLWAINRRYA